MDSDTTDYCLLFAVTKDLPVMVEHLARIGMIPNWKRIGLQLGLTLPQLRIIQKDETEEYDRFTSMLDLWLRTCDATKQALEDALKKIQ